MSDKRETQMATFSRREMLACASLAAAGAAFGKVSSNEPERSPKWLPAAYADVTLGEGPLLNQFRAQHATLLAMDDDALLKPFRSAAGLPAPGPDLGGWYNEASSFNPPADMHGYIPGHSFGQYVSSLARAYAVTGDEPTRAKVARLIEAYGASVSPRFYQGYPLPAYTFD